MNRIARKIAIAVVAALTAGMLCTAALAASYTPCGWCALDHDHSCHALCTLNHDHALDANCWLYHDHAQGCWNGYWGWYTNANGTNSTSTNVNTNTTPGSYWYGHHSSGCGHNSYYNTSYFGGHHGGHH